MTLQTLLERADNAVQAGDLKAAHTALRAAYALKPSRATACDLGLVARGLEIWAEAVTYLSQCTAGAQPTGMESARFARLRAELVTAQKALEASASAPSPAPSSIPSSVPSSAPALAPPTSAPSSMAASAPSSAPPFAESSSTPLAARISEPLPPPLPTWQVDRRVAGFAILTGASAVLTGAFLGVAQFHFNKAEDSMQQNPAACLQGPNGADACKSLRSSFSNGNAYRDYANVSLFGAGVSFAATVVLAHSPRAASPTLKTGQGLTLELVW